MPRRPSVLTKRLLSELLEASPAEVHGYELMRRVNAKSGALYPALRRLQEQGWVASRREAVGETDAGRPPRVYHRLTSEGVECAAEALAAGRGAVDAVRYAR